MSVKRKYLGLLLSLVVLAATMGGGVAKSETDPAAFSGLWQGMFTLEGLPLPGGVLLEMKSDGAGTARIGFDDEYTRQSVDVILLEGLRLQGGGEADEMKFLLDAVFVPEDSGWHLSGEMVIDDGYDVITAELAFFQDDGTPGDESAAFAAQMAYPDTRGNSIDFSGEWTGTMLVADISGPNAAANANLQDQIFDCSLTLDLSDPSRGTGDIFQGDNVFGPGLTASVQYDRLTLTGLLWNDDFEWYGTFEQDDETGEWTLVGGGDITSAEVNFHIVLRLTKAVSRIQETEVTPTAQSSAEPPDSSLPLDEFVVGSWMREASAVISERTVHVFRADGSCVTYSALPGPDDSESTWIDGNWKAEEISGGNWSIADGQLAVTFENSLLSFNTQVEKEDDQTIRIQEMYTKRYYLRLPEPGE